MPFISSPFFFCPLFLLLFFFALYFFSFFLPFISSRGRLKGDQPAQRNRTPNGPRPPHSKPSPKAHKKTFPGHSSQAPPPPIAASSKFTSAESTASTESGSEGASFRPKMESSTSSSPAQSAPPLSPSPQPPKKLSYAQMAQKRNSKELCDLTDDLGNKLAVAPSSAVCSIPPQTVISTTPASVTQSTSITKEVTPTISQSDVNAGLTENLVGDLVLKPAVPSPMKEAVVGERASKGKTA